MDVDYGLLLYIIVNQQTTTIQRLYHFDVLAVYIDPIQAVTVFQLLIHSASWLFVFQRSSLIVKRRFGTIKECYF